MFYFNFKFILGSVNLVMLRDNASQSSGDHTCCQGLNPVWPVCQETVLTLYYLFMSGEF